MCEIELDNDADYAEYGFAYFYSHSPSEIARLPKQLHTLGICFQGLSSLVDIRRLHSDKIVNPNEKDIVFQGLVAYLESVFPGCDMVTLDHNGDRVVITE